jgi:hypothetical protein
MITSCSSPYCFQWYDAIPKAKHLVPRFPRKDETSGIGFENHF